MDTNSNHLFSLLNQCRLCPRECGVNRLAGQRGRCGADSRVFVARAALHMWEEPCICGDRGSGAVFFTGCALGCCFCQNVSISRPAAYQREKPFECQRDGPFDNQKDRVVKRTVPLTALTPLDTEDLARIFLRLQSEGAVNINLVTGSHYIPQIVYALKEAKRQGLKIPVLYNSSGYEKAESLRLLEGLVDIWLPDFKYMSPELAGALSGAPDYPEAAMASLQEMMRQARNRQRLMGSSQTNTDSMLQAGVIVRLLLLPGHVKDAKAVVRYLWNTYGDEITISLMSQYTPMPQMAGRPPLDRRVTRREYDRLVDYALELGVTNAFIQDRETAVESFIPDFSKGSS